MPLDPPQRCNHLCLGAEIQRKDTLAFMSFLSQADFNVTFSIDGEGKHQNLHCSHSALGSNLRANLLTKFSPEDMIRNNCFVMHTLKSHSKIGSSPLTRLYDV